MQIMRLLQKNRIFKKKKYEKSMQSFFSLFSLVSVFIFAFWWFNPQHVPHNFTGAMRMFDILLFLLVSYIIWHPIIMEVLTWCISSHIKDIHKQKPIPGLKVAFITTIVPQNEPIELLHSCLPAMVKANYGHDTWVLDEGNNEEVKRVCGLYGVKHFSRLEKNRYNTTSGKFTKTKGGNHNSWYEICGNQYDIVAQIDTDFVPKRDFLTKTLGYFRDPKVAFVGTPQIYGNTNYSLVALGAAQQQFNFYGAVLRGLSGMGMTLLIGANHVVRVSAFKKVGHYTAHITEDLITGMKLHAHGYKSVYVPYPLAIGEGPVTWESYFNQQLRWAYGCIDILFRHSKKYFKKMGWRQSLYYFFLQQHYFSGLAMALSIMLLTIYFFFGLRTANVDIFQFFASYSVILLITWLMSIWLQRYDIYRKKEGELLLSGKIISIAAWPIWFLAFLNALTGKRLTYKVTPKGEHDTNNKTSPMIFFPHFAFATIAMSGLAASMVTHRQNIAMILWGLSSAVLMLTIPFVNTFVQRLSNIQVKLYGYIKSRYINSKDPTIQSSALGATQHAYELLRDCLFLGFIVLLSVGSYIYKIGFYSDDWSFLGNFTLSHNQSLIGLYQTATTPNTFMRPVQNLYDAVLFWLFGTHPLGYQLVNTYVFIGIILLFYIILRYIRIPRIIALTVPLVYALLPNYSTDRFWYAAFQVNLSTLFFLFSTYTGLKSFSSQTKKMFIWKTISIFSLVMSALSYEVILPFVFVNMILFWNPVERLLRNKNDKNNHTQNHAVFIILNFIVLLYLIFFKAKTTTRLDSFNYPGDIIHLVSSISRTNFGTLGVKAPYIWGAILSQYAHSPMLLLAFFLYIVVFLYLFFTTSIPAVSFPKATFMRTITISGVVLFLLGYAIFFANNKVGFSPTGIDNRVASAAAIGIAFIIVGGAGWMSRLLPSEKLSKWFFCTTISILCAGGFLMVNTIALFWASSYQQSSLVLADIYQHFPTMPKNSTLILDGICPYIGPGIVFESQWDLKGAMQTIYHDPTIQADIVTPRLKIANQSINTQIYTFKAYYPYRRLFIYNFKYKRKFYIPNIQAAYAYFQKFNPDYNNNCPAATAGNGVTIF